VAGANGRTMTAQGRDGRRAALTLDPAVAGHLACALTGYRKALVSTGQAVPEGVEDLLAGALKVVRSGQRLAPDHRAHHDGSVFLTMAEAATLVRVSPRTLRRRIADGDLAVRRVGRRVLVERADLLAFVEAR
jgi:excisionase family DNA binding protein